jgi:uncharacterized protein YsxB (DUF464 family)
MLRQSCNVSSSEVIVYSQLSVAVAVPFAAILVEAGHSSVIEAGQVIVGAVVSVRVIGCVQLASLPHASVAVHTRSTSHVLPGINVSLEEMSTSVQLSLAVALLVFAGPAPRMHSTEI